MSPVGPGPPPGEQLNKGGKVPSELTEKGAVMGFRFLPSLAEAHFVIPSSRLLARDVE